MSIRDLLYDAAHRLTLAGVDSARLDARVLLAHAMGVTREDLIAAKREPSAREAALFESFVARRIAREPVAYIRGMREFWSLDFKVGPGVLVPRPETETLIEAAVSTVSDRVAPLSIADLGAGSGALLVAALKEFSHARGTGFERSAQAFAYAQANLVHHGLKARGKLIAGDWNEAEGQFDLIFSNPPYIPTADIRSLDPEIRLHEPVAALDGGGDGLAAYHDLAGLLPRLLRPGGLAFLELGQGQAARVELLFQGLTVVHVAPDLAGIPRVLVLRAPK
ncbi:MAG TPA: peptide chain release factor N(5)-glutamine methyltransferase [Rhizomicrobium sp.]|nr:peptide chain release factor N(5)-glutamine methyltransferase [Rhizomicrobium sp.]